MQANRKIFTHHKILQAQIFFACHLQCGREFLYTILIGDIIEKNI